jgi:hypothetical protein
LPAEETNSSVPEAIQGENAAPVPTRDEDFYFEDGDLVILVENTLIKVYFLCLALDNCFTATDPGHTQKKQTNQGAPICAQRFAVYQGHA